MIAVKMGKSSFIFFLALVMVPAIVVGSGCSAPIKATDQDLLQFPLNLEFMEEEFFCYGAIGVGLDHIAPELTLGGPPPIGVQKANLDPLTRQIIEEFCYQEVGHIRSIIKTVGGFPRPLYDFTAQNFATLFDKAIGYKLNPPFNPYRNTINYLLASYVIPYVGLTGYVGTIPNLYNYTTKRLAGSLLGVEAGQDAVIRTMLYEKMEEEVEPYKMSVAEFTNKISWLRNKLGMCGIKDEGIIVPLKLGAENRTHSNVLAADANSLSYARTPPEILRIVYGSGSEHMPGGFLPRGGNGRIARTYLHKH
ncbi:ferritin-like catalase Nec2 [Euphorbia lathyris]|uniref:ferritin-like catalase Nec2 n=1 Tax=Euphorbia lathyris TaxID=212925 RepID=UPI003313FCAB